MLNWDRNMQTIGRSIQRSAFLFALGLAWLPSAHAAPEGAAIKPGVVPAGIDKSAIPGRAIPSVKPEESDDDGGDATDAAEEESSTTESSATTFSPPRQKPPILDPNAKIMLDFVNKPIMDLIKYMAEITGRNFILTDDIKGEVTIISHKAVTVPAAYEAFLSSLEQTGYTTVSVGNITKVVSSNIAGKTPIRVHQNGNIPFTDNFVTQVIELENVTVSDISSVVKELMSKDASVISYAPANTLILTDAATNIRKIYRIINQLDIAAPKARLNVVPLSHAQATEVQKIIQDLYGTASSGSSTTSSKAEDRRSRRRNRLRDRVSRDKGGSATNVGAEGKYIEKIIADERTNSLIIMANDEAMTAVLNLIGELDVDVDPSSRAQIHVVYLEHAKSEEVASVLSNLAQSSGNNDSRMSAARRRAAAQRAKTSGARGAASTATSAATSAADATGGATAAFEDGVRITSDENTNSLVIIATQDQFAILRSVIEKLDIRRMQVFVEAVILEIGSDDELNVGLGFHMGNVDNNGSLSIGSGQFNGSSMGLSQDILSGMAVGIYGKPIDVDVASPIDGSTVTMSVPAFGVALNAMQGDSSVNILSTPNILTMDNEEAKIVVGKNVPFKAGSSMSGTGTTIQNITREDVGLTLKVTPQINESRFVTLEVFQEVQELQESADSDLGPTTSKRSAETTVVVRDNQTVVIGGLIGSTETESETKVPILGDLPLLGMFFRGRRAVASKTNMMIFLTPHIIEEPEDLEEVYRIKWAQRQEYIKRFYGKSREKADAAMNQLLKYSMNQVDKPSVYRTKVSSQTEAGGFTTIGAEAPNVNPIDPALIAPEAESPAPASDQQPALETEGAE
ncbi:MAG: type II secretion system secretin GspD [Myxococcota bacterium]|nr:type II secretion system secretin GspD [Myxococcota bacterium]